MNAKRWQLWLPGLILLVGLLGLGWRILLWQPPAGTDDISYFLLGQKLTPSPGESIQADRLRLVLLGEIQGFTRLLGGDLPAFYGLVHFNALLSLVALVALALTVGNTLTAMGMTLLWAFSYTYYTVDTRLLPDNLGTALGLLGVVAVLRAGQSETTRRWHLLLAATGGFLFWSAYGVRASFGIMAIIGLLAAWWHPRRWLILPMVILGLAVGFALEAIYFTYQYQDPLIAYKVLTQYKDGLVKLATTNDESARQAAVLDLPSTTVAAPPPVVVAAPPWPGWPEWRRFLWRYPQALIHTGSAEIFFFLFGWLGAGLWLRQLRSPLARIKLLGLGLSFGLTALAVVSIRPLTPVMTESIRYYQFCAPWFYLATIELALGAWGGLARIAPMVGPWARWVILVGLLALLGLNGQVILLRQDAVFLGNDAIFQIAATIREATGNQPGIIVQHKSPARVTKLLLPPQEGWIYRSHLDESHNPEGWLIVDWRRLNFELGIGGGDYTKFGLRYLELLERFPLLLRHRHGRYLTDLFRLTAQPVVRPKVAIGDGPSRWTLLPAGITPVSTMEEGQVMTLPPKSILYSGVATLDAFPAQGGRLPEDRFLEVAVQAVGGTKNPANVQVAIRRRLDNGRILRQEMGELWYYPPSGVTDRALPFWTYLPDATADFQIRLQTGEEPITITRISLWLLERLPEENPKQIGGLW